MTRICVSLADRREVTAPGLYEVRLDRIEGAPPALPTGSDLIATCRPAWEGGGFTGSEDARRARLEEGARGAWAVDVEVMAGWRPSREGRRLILSHHDFERTPPDLAALVGRMELEKPDFVKVAATPRSAEDLALLLKLQRSLGARGVVVAMGDLGAPARILAARQGAPWTYAAPDGGEPTAPGQFAASELRDLFRVESLGRSTRAFCVAGDPVSHSRSPALFNAFFRAAGLDAVYVPARLPGGNVCECLEALGIEGASVTIPHKEEAYRGCRADRHAERARAVNTLAWRGGAWEGTNTDARGFRTALEAGLGRRAEGLKVLVLGAGGVARAVLAALLPGNRVAIRARTASKAAALAKEFGAEAAEGRKAGWELLVNATPVGMAPAVEETPIAADELAPGAAVFDCVYTPAETRLLREAKEKGCRTIGGVGMFLEQAKLQAEYWFGAGEVARLPMSDRL